MTAAEWVTDTDQCLRAVYLFDGRFTSDSRDTDKSLLIGHSLTASEEVTDNDQCLRAVYLFDRGCEKRKEKKS